MGHVSCKGICSENTVWSQQTHTHTHCGHWYFSIMLWCFEMRCQAWLGSLVLPMRAMLFCYCVSVSRSLSHPHWFILLLFTLSCSCFLPLFGWQCTPNKMEFGTFSDCWQDCWTAIKCTTASKCQYAHCKLGSGHLVMLMPEEKSGTQWMHTKKHTLPHDFVSELANKSGGTRMKVNKVV